jgi:RNA polymerase sigma-70 factor (ECF subfamily)
VANDAINTFDFNALSSFYSSEYNLLVSIGVYHGFDLDQVKDVIHQLFLDFAEKKIDLHMVTSPTSYIVTSFKRRLIDIHRYNSRRSNLDPYSYNDTAQESVERLLEQKETATGMAAQLLNAYEQLPERCKKVIFLKYYGGLSNDEIRKRTGLSLRSIYNNLSAGIRQMRTALTSPSSTNLGKIAGLFFLFFVNFPA